MAVIAVVNLKGGCGKSNVSVNVACELAKKTSSVILIDADAQGTATHYASSNLLPVQAEHLPLEDARELDKWIRRILAMTADYIVLDAPPHVGNVTKAIIGIADLVLVPCTPSTADLIATIPTIDLIREARSVRSDHGPKCLLVPSRVDVRTASGRDIESALKKFGEPLGSAVHQRSAFVDAFTAGRWIGDFAPSSSAYQDIVALTSKVKRELSK